MVRTKKQLIDLLATKNKSQDLIKATVEDGYKISEIFAPHGPTSPLPAMIIHDEKIQHPFSLSIQSPVSESKLSFEPPYVMNNFWPPLPSLSDTTLSTQDATGKKLGSMFSNINMQEIQEMLKDCAYNEDEAILRLITQTDYLENIRHRLRANNKTVPWCSQIKPLHMSPVQPKPPVQHILKENNIRLSSQMPPSQYIVPKSVIVSKSPPLTENVLHSTPLPPLNTETVVPKKETPPQVVKEVVKPPPSKPAKNEPAEHQHKTHKKHHRLSTHISSGSRLTLDDALQQIQDSKTNDDMDGYAGWSAARLRAFKMIEKNPNSYYYRFNAPGEQQKKGKWTDEENALFLQRLKQVGANSQWGIFSIAIPGRVGYQCSNYYRFMIETGQLHDPNYVLDSKGKARYLFDKKTEDGAVEKIFRKHSKHGSISAAAAETLDHIGSDHTAKKRKQIHPRQEIHSDEDDPTFDIRKPSSSYSKKKSSA
ncbi:hypothetical protein INT47_004508, partial [Mucor saturninus]